jgi:hypothetical protein
LATAEIVGGVFAGGGGGGGRTVTVNVSVAVSPPLSITVMVIVAVPICPAAGVIVIARSSPDPFRMSPSCGTKTGLSDETVTVSPVAGVSASETLNGTAPVLPPSGTI